MIYSHLSKQKKPELHSGFFYFLLSNILIKSFIHSFKEFFMLLKIENYSIWIDHLLFQNFLDNILDLHWLIKFLEYSSNNLLNTSSLISPLLEPIDTKPKIYKHISIFYQFIMNGIEFNIFIREPLKNLAWQILKVHWFIESSHSIKHLELHCLWSDIWEVS